MRDRAGANIPSRRRARTEFQRDRDRIVHSTAFRRLVYKTQAPRNYEVISYIARAPTHSMQVALDRPTNRLRMLRLLEACRWEATCPRATTSGHTPFGHAGHGARRAALNIKAGGASHAGGFAGPTGRSAWRALDELLRSWYVDFRRAESPRFERKEESAGKHFGARPRTPGGRSSRRHRPASASMAQQPGLEGTVAKPRRGDALYKTNEVDDSLRPGLHHAGAAQGVGRRCAITSRRAFDSTWPAGRQRGRALDDQPGQVMGRDHPQAHAASCASC